MDNATILSIFNSISLSLFVTISLLIAGRIGYRALVYRKAQEKLPILLKRDLYLFSSIGLFMILLAFIRVAGIQGLQQNIFWLAFTNFLLLGPFAFWAYVEWTQ
jgi:ABC-type microcin C transport system permease subunit YejB